MSMPVVDQAKYPFYTSVSNKNSGTAVKSIFY